MPLRITLAVAALFAYSLSRQPAPAVVPTPAPVEAPVLSVEVPEGDTAHYLFRARDFGFRTRFGAGLLVRLPFPLVAGVKIAHAT